MNRHDFAPTIIRTAMQGKPWRHDILRQVTKGLMGREIARPGKTAHERARKLGKA
jgi:hypothetical protein